MFRACGHEASDDFCSSNETSFKCFACQLIQTKKDLNDKRVSFFLYLHFAVFLLMLLLKSANKMFLIRVELFALIVLLI